jgi:hypothetical protein
MKRGRLMARFLCLSGVAIPASRPTNPPRGEIDSNERQAYSLCEINYPCGE